MMVGDDKNNKNVKKKKKKTGFALNVICAFIISVIFLF